VTGERRRACLADNVAEFRTKSG